MNIEINISCPNIEKDMVEEDIQKFINKNRKWCILKLSPLCTEEKIDNFYKLGFRQFHCCNTLPTKNGGLSGESLIPYSTKIIKNIKKKYSDTIVIGGGGIKGDKEIQIYKDFGANHFSISTLFFHPYQFCLFYNNCIKK